MVEPFSENDFEDDESHVNLSVEELAGIPMLKVEVLDQDEYGDYKIPKIRIHMEKLFEGHEADLEKIFTVKADVVTKAVGEFTGDDGVSSLVPGNFMGAFVTQPAKMTEQIVGISSMSSARLSGHLSGVPMSLQ